MLAKFTAAVIFFPLTIFPAYAEEAILRLSGSSTVFPFASVVAERISEQGYSNIVVESAGTGAGFRAFCSNARDSIDIANASRRMTMREFKTCSDASVGGIVELKIGYDGVIMIKLKNGSESMKLTSETIFLALASQVPSSNGMIQNSYKYWSEIDSNLPRQEIKFFGPPTTSGTRDSFVELVMHPGAKQALPSYIDTRIAATDFRRDGAYVPIGESDNLVLKKLAIKGDHAIGILGFSYFDQNRDKFQAQYFENVLPTFENILSGKYKVSRALYMYVKADSLNSKKVVQVYLQELLSNRAIGSYGYLTNKGLIPAPLEENQLMKERIENELFLSIQDLN